MACLMAAPILSKALIAAEGLRRRTARAHEEALDGDEVRPAIGRRFGGPATPAPERRRHRFSSPRRDKFRCRCRSARSVPWWRRLNCRRCNGIKSSKSQRKGRKRAVTWWVRDGYSQASGDMVGIETISACCDTLCDTMPVLT